MGYGSKMPILTSSVHVPSPQVYNIRSLFEGCKKGYIFGIGREKLKNGGIFASSATPGPGAYSPLEANKKLKISLKTKLRPIEESNAKNPGPGSCTQIRI